MALVVSFYCNSIVNTLHNTHKNLEKNITLYCYARKEVLIISITSAIVMNFMLTQRLFNAAFSANDAILPVSKSE